VAEARDDEPEIVAHGAEDERINDPLTQLTQKSLGFPSDQSLGTKSGDARLS
jgi:hypothetical protein